MENQSTTIDDSTYEVDWNNNGFLIFSLRSTELIREGGDRAAMASSEKGSARVIRDKSVAMVDCSASSRLTGLQTIIATNNEVIIPLSSRQVELGFSQISPALVTFDDDSLMPHLASP